MCVVLCKWLGNEVHVKFYLHQYPFTRQFSVPLEEVLCSALHNPRADSSKKPSLGKTTETRRKPAAARQATKARQSTTMCVTNVAKRHQRQVNRGNAVVSSKPSLISQRLMGNFMPHMLDTTTTTTPKQTAGAAPSTNSTPFSAGQGTQPQTAFPEVAATYGASTHTTRNSLPGQTEEVKRRPRRRRKPQKPGKTAKQNDRHFVIHNYHDHAQDADENDVEEEPAPRRRGGVTVSFPVKLHAVLDQVEADGLGHIISWQSHGRCFVIHKPKEFVDHVMPNYFRQTKLTSFQRQLNLYGFSRITRGKDMGGYYHELFLRGKIFLTKRMQRTKVKGTKFKAASSPDQEPDFYSMVSEWIFGFLLADHFIRLVSSYANNRFISHLLRFHQPPVLVTPQNTSDESSGDEENSGSDGAPTRLLPADETLFPVYASNQMSSEPLSFQAPVNPPMPMFASDNVVARPGSYGTPTAAAPLEDDVPVTWQEPGDALDEAVEELFRNDPLVEGMIDLEKIWDTSVFGDDSVQDDFQLGCMLDKMLEEV